MKTKKFLMIIFAIVIFGITANYLQGISLIGIDQIPLSDYPWGPGKLWIIFYMIICPATGVAAIPLIPEMVRKK